jgi:hypoxanthine-guanine phosphoribosyltransferase
VINTSFPNAFPDVFYHINTFHISNHNEHEKAKNGDIGSAYKIVKDCLNIGTILELKTKFNDAIIVPVISIEKNANVLPLVYAKTLGKLTGFKVEEDIIKSNKTSHTNKKALARILTRAQFEGPVEQDKNYIVIDDVITTGGILNELRNYIQERGGNVLAASTLGYKRHSYILAISNRTILDLERKFDNNEFEKILRENGIGNGIKNLTNAEGRYFLLYKSIDSIREKISEIKSQISVRDYGRETSRSNFRRVAERTGDKEKPKLDYLLSRAKEKAEKQPIKPSLNSKKEKKRQ